MLSASQSSSPASSVFPYERWGEQLPELARRYSAAHPFPHLVLDDFLEPTAAEAALAQFPLPNSGEWIQWMHLNERKIGRRDRREFPPALGAVVDELNSPRFVALLSRLTGIDGLMSDETLEGGGLHQTERNGYLNIHSDFTEHPHRHGWRRRVNVLLYLNKDWQDAYNGHLELWNRDMSAPGDVIAPLFNRAVIFNTDEFSFHGHPEPLQVPEGMTRKSIALYFLTNEGHVTPSRSTEYRARPGDNPLPIYLDTLALRIYDRVKRRFGLTDRGVSRALGLLARLRRK